MLTTGEVQYNAVISINLKTVQVAFGIISSKATVLVHLGCL